MNGTPAKGQSAAGRDKQLAKLDGLLTPDSDLPRGGPPPLFRGLTPDEQNEILNAGKRRVLNRGALLFRQGSPQDGIFLIESGRIKVFYIGPSGREITLAYWHAGHFVGGPDVFERGTHVWSGTAAANSAVLHLPGDFLRKMTLKTPALAVNIIDGLSFKGKCYSALAQMLGTRSPVQRLAQLLLHLANLYGLEESGGTFITASFTQAEFAHMTGVTRQSVTTTLKRFVDSGVVAWSGPNLVIQNIAQLSLLRDGKKKPV